MAESESLASPEPAVASEAVPQGVVDPPAAEGDPPPEADSPDQEAADTKASKEAAKYRRQLRAAESERDGLAARLESVQRSQIDAQVVATGIKPAALWASGVDIADLLAEDGTVDSERVADAVTGVREQFGIQTSRPYRGIKGLQSGASSSVPATNNWCKAFSPQDR